MADVASNRANALRFISGIGTGNIPTDLIAADFSGWSGLSGELTGSEFLARAATIIEVFPDGLHFTFHESVAENELVAVRAEADGITLTGETYHNDLHYLLQFAPDGKLSKVWEYMNTKATAEVVRPAFEELMRRKAATP